MENLYESNGLVFWSEAEIECREMLQKYFLTSLKTALKEQNSAFDFFRVEAPLLTPRTRINPNYPDKDMYCQQGGELTLRPETTMGSYLYAQHLLNSHNKQKVRMPLVVWQHGKSFRREQDQSTKFMRLKEFYQLEFQIIYAKSTANDYSVAIVPAVQKMISDLLGSCRTEPSDRIPDYSEGTTDVIFESNNMEVCSISKRKDFPDAKVLEVAIGTDRCVYNFLNKGKPQE